MKTHRVISLMLMLGILPFCVRSQDVYTYDVSWPAKQLTGTFTLGFGPALNHIYVSTQAEGTFGNGDGTQTTWTSVDFDAEPTSAALFFFGQNGIGRSFEANPPTVDKQIISWTDANQAWTALLTQGAADGVSISVVPEPADAVLLLVGQGLLWLMAYGSARPVGNYLTKHWRS